MLGTEIIRKMGKERHSLTLKAKSKGVGQEFYNVTWEETRGRPEIWFCTAPFRKQDLPNYNIWWELGTTEE